MSQDNSLWKQPLGVSNPTSCPNLAQPHRQTRNSHQVTGTDSCVCEVATSLGKVKAKLLLLTCICFCVNKTNKSRSRLGIFSRRKSVFSLYWHSSSALTHICQDIVGEQRRLCSNSCSNVWLPCSFASGRLMR